MRDKYRLKRTKNNFVTFVWKVVLGIGVIYLAIWGFAETAEWRATLFEAIQDPE